MSKAMFSTIVIVCGPVIIYRYLIVRHPVKAKTAKWIAIVYGIIAFIIFCLLIGTSASVAPVFLWSYVNYLMLTKGKKPASKDAENDDETQ